jgi:conflict system pore-forming effector with SLATT domain
MPGWSVWRTSQREGRLRDRKHIVDTKDYPALFQSSDEAALEAQRNYFRLLESYLAVVVLASIASILGGLGDPGWSRMIAGINALLLAVAVLLAWLMRARRFERAWFDCRAVAESVKTATWRYMMILVPFKFETDSDSLQRAFVGLLSSIRKDRAGVESHLAGHNVSGTEITDFMRASRKLSFEGRKELYLRYRVSDQRCWYETKSAENKTAASRWLNLVLFLQIVALAFAISRILWPVIPVIPVSPVLTFVSALLAWSQAMRHEELIGPYAAAAHELRELETLLSESQDPRAFEEYAREIEENISREHTMWLARYGIPRPGIQR